MPLEGAWASEKFLGSFGSFMATRVFLSGLFCAGGGRRRELEVVLIIQILTVAALFGGDSF